jgi:hypothetical protein
MPLPPRELIRRAWAATPRLRRGSRIVAALAALTLSSWTALIGVFSSGTAGWWAALSMSLLLSAIVLVPQT